MSDDDLTLWDSRTLPSSQESEVSTSAWSGQDGRPSASARSTPTHPASSRSGGPGYRTSAISSSSETQSSEQRVWYRHQIGGYREGYGVVTTLGNMHYVTTGEALTSGPEDSPVRISASEDYDEVSPDHEAVSPSPSLTLFDYIDPGLSSSRTSKGSSLLTPVATLQRSSIYWSSSGMGGPSGWLTRSSSACPSADDECSSSLSTLPDILTRGAPDRFWLSARGAAGIITRSGKRGKTLPPDLQAALIAQSRSSETTSQELSSQPTRKDSDTIKTSSSSSTDHPGSETTTSSRRVVRRLTPLESERLMGYPDGWTISTSWLHKKESRSARS